MSTTARLPWLAGTPRLTTIVERLTATPLVPLAVFLVLGLYDIASKSVWVDEGISIALTRLPTMRMLDYMARLEMHAAPYYLFLHPWLALGQSEFVIRSLSVLFGSAAVLATWELGRRYGFAFRAALIVAVMPALIEYGQQAKGYTLLAATSAVATLLLLRLIDKPGPVRAVLYVTAAIVLVYAHPVGAFIVLAHAAIVLMFAPRERRIRLLLIFVPVLVGSVPMVVFAMTTGEKFAWVPQVSLEAVSTELVMLGGGLLAAAVLGVALVFGARRDAMTVWLIVPVLGALVASVLLQPVFRHPYLLGVLPAAAVVASRSPRPLVAAVVLAGLIGTIGWYQAPSREDWRAAAAWVDLNAQPGDGIVFAPGYVRPAFGYYARVGEPLYPPNQWLSSDLGGGPVDAARFAAAPRIFLVQQDGREASLPTQVSEALNAFEPVETRTFAGGNNVRVTLMVRDPVPVE